MKRAPAKAPLSHWLGPAGLILAAAGTPLFFSSSFVAVYAFPKLLGLCAGVCLAAWGAVRSPAGAGASPLDRPLLACAGALAVCAVFSLDRAVSVLGQHNFYAHGLLAGCLLLALAALASRLSRGREEALLKACLAAYTVVGAFAVLQWAGVRLSVGLPDHWRNARAISSLGSPVSLGQALVLILPLALHWALEKRSALGWACLLAGAGGLYASISRGAWLAAALACALYLVLRHGLAPLKRPRNAAAAAVLALLVAAGLLQRLQQRPFTAGDGGRAHIWRTAWTLFSERPLFGWGSDAFALASRPHKTVEFARQSNAVEVPGHAHNDLLQALATTGLVGAAAYLWLLAALAVSAARAARDTARPWGLALACGLLGLFFGAKFNPVALEALACAALFAGLLAPAAAKEAAPAGRPALAAALAASAALLLAGRMALAERAQKEGHRHFAARRLDSARLSMERAAAWNPWEPSYRHALINVLCLRAAGGLPPQERRFLLAEARAQGEELLRRHPRDANSHYFHGVALLNLAWAGDAAELPAAERALDAALALDPVFPPLLQLRRDAALSRGDAALASELDARLKAVATRDYGTTVRVPVSSPPKR